MSDRSPSQLAGSLEIASNLLAHHLRVLDEAGLVERVPSSGDARRRYLRLVPTAVAAIGQPVTVLAARHLLFVCTANSARSQMAAAVWNARHAVPASSAGTRPADAVRSGAVKAAKRAGLDLAATVPRSIGEVTEDPDLVITVCDVAHEELGSLFPEVRVLHWSIPDPSSAPSARAFDTALRLITTRIESLAAHVQPSVPRRGSG
jgi:ArsR family transcriptional regulator, arsenate/arsenite/antimonite-responsive transcriptional repressor / arsenate reductase (thioredoxin)